MFHLRQGCPKCCPRPFASHEEIRSCPHRDSRMQVWSTTKVIASYRGRKIQLAKIRSKTSEDFFLDLHLFFRAKCHCLAKKLTLHFFFSCTSIARTHRELSTVRLNFGKKCGMELRTVFPGKLRYGRKIWYHFFRT